MQPREKILIVEDSEPMAMAYADFLQPQFGTFAVHDLKSAREYLLAEQPLALLLDLQLPDGDGLDLIPEIRDKGGDFPIVAITSDSSVETAVRALQLGADDFLEKPFSADRLRTTVLNGIEKRKLKLLVESYESDAGRQSFEGFIGASLVMQGVYHMVESAAPSKATVFITGESGTGKEVLARAVHARSPRRKAAFVALNCGAIPTELMESEIFGHLKGAFTGAAKDRKGAALQADGGTLFLDEVCEMEPELQVKLLRFLQTEQFRAVGSDTETQVDVRILCATNKDPMSEVRAGRFREDLYYRLHVINISLPPLRERNNDILLIAESLLGQYAKEENKAFVGFDNNARRYLLDYAWPGNVRELQNVIRQMVVLNNAPLVTATMFPYSVSAGIAGGTFAARPDEKVVVTASRLSDNQLSGNHRTENVLSRPRQQDESPTGAESADSVMIQPLWQIEEAHIARALRFCDDNVPRAAALLEVSPSTLYRKLKRNDE
ncbi:MAG: sigma-54 dependent transcriptional regulator [Pseudomonadales bacterium]|nr:sigma-54 dependent transcriptional regulator [Pseudomonadales bacterium]MDP4640874.1 sigma-54 dependent transcriptional regulator [Pseudomonadales bacterium]